MADSLERRVRAAPTTALDRNGFVAPVDVLTGLGWLRPEHADAWRRGRIPYLERVTVAGLGKLNKTLRIPRCWAQQCEFQPHETSYVSWTKDRHLLRFTKTGDQNLERAYRTHRITPGLVAAAATTRSRAPEPDRSVSPRAAHLTSGYEHAGRSVPPGRSY